MSFEAQDCFVGIQGLLANRQIAQATMLEAIRKCVLELTEDYQHPLLENTGPTVQLTPLVPNYDPDFFMQPADAGLDVSKINSFFLYTNSYTLPPSPNESLTNAGYDLKYASIATVEVLMQIPGVPTKWTRNNNQIYVASMPVTSYWIFARYQKQHPNSNVVNGFSLTQQIMMADTWQEIVEYGSALRLAPQVNLANKKEELHEALYGDSKFQSSSGIEGAPGLIFQRTSQRNRDQATTTRRLRLRMG